MAGEEVDPDNGLVLKGIYIPEEVLVLILSNLDAKTIVKFRRVCKQWRDVASGPVWHEKASREIPGLSISFLRHHKLSWVDFFWMCHKKPFSRSMIKNSCGQDKFEHWNMTHAGDGWKVEREPNGCDPFPKDFKSCFVTSYGKCSAEQQIELKKEGLTQAVMDKVNPVITISDWYAARWDCGIEYKIAVSLLNSNWEVIAAFHFNDKLDDADRTTWRNVKHEFKNYGKGVRFIQFYHSGKDTQFWAGHYGAKMTGAEVTITLPDESSSSNQMNEDDSGWMSTSSLSSIFTNYSSDIYEPYQPYSSGNSYSSLSSPASDSSLSSS